MESAPQRDQVLAVFLGVTKWPRKLHEQATELARPQHWPQTFFEVADFSGLDAAVMRELPSKLGGEQKFRIVRYLSDPQASDLRPDGLVERSVDFNRVEVSRNIFQRVKPSRLSLLVKDFIPA